VDAEKLKLYETEMRKEVERTISFDLRWEESVTPAEGGGVTLLRILRSAKVERVIGGQPEAGPLPIDYQDALLEINLNAGGRITGRRFTAPRLVAAEKEILEQFLEVEPFPELPAAITPGERVERVSSQLIPSETRDAAPTNQVTTDRYQLAAAVERAGEKSAPPAAGAGLRLDRDSLIEGAGGTLNPIRTLGRFWLALNAAGLVSDCHGSYEQSYTEILAAPPELLAVPQAPPPDAPPGAGSAPAKAASGANAPPASSTAASAPQHTPAPAVRITPLPEGKVRWAYRLPGSFTLSRKPLPLPAPVTPQISASAPPPAPCSAPPSNAPGSPPMTAPAKSAP
jgi:hypothetical protein